GAGLTATADSQRLYCDLFSYCDTESTRWVKCASTGRRWSSSRASCQSTVVMQVRPLCLPLLGPVCFVPCFFLLLRKPNWTRLELPVRVGS
uniref:Uncharacterized protein n=1 Tax=Malurus cyaneus samueli TaxID=2593467 RepID=A0A8C5X5H9_9PASS